MIAIVGPTAAGKSAIAVELAATLDGEIVNADSRQIYRGMDIGTAKPGPADRRLVPHHLYDICDPRETYSLARYRRDVRAAIEEIWARGRIPWLVGGTGQYIWALLENWQVPDVPPDDDLRRELAARAAEEGHEALHAELRAVDPLAAERISPRNVRRVIRALEVYRHSGRPISSLQTKEPPDFEFLVFGVRREPDELKAAIKERTEAMFAEGFLAEVQGLLEARVPEDAPAMSSIGYGEAIRHLRGEIDLKAAKSLVAQATRRLARRQLKWFRREDPRILWRRSASEMLPEACSFLEKGQAAPRDRVNGGSPGVLPSL